MRIEIDVERDNDNTYPKAKLILEGLGDTIAISLDDNSRIVEVSRKELKSALEIL